MITDKIKNLQVYKVTHDGTVKRSQDVYTVSQKMTLMLRTITSMHINRFW